MSRIDLLIARKTDFSRQKIQALIDGLCVKYKGNIVQKSSTKVPEDADVLVCKDDWVSGGSDIEILLPAPSVSEILPKDMPLNIVYEDADLMVVNKQAGISTHPGAGDVENTLVNGLLYYAAGNLSTVGGFERPGIVHRLDKDTSGLLLVAKNDLTHVRLSKALEERLIKRTYLALCYGVPRLLRGTVETNIDRDRFHRQRMAICPVGQGKRAVTHYRLLESYLGGRIGLIECNLETGRTHQIRVHLTHIGCPLVGDKTYGVKNKAFIHKLAKDQPDLEVAILNLSGQALHAVRIEFNHPTTAQNIALESPLREDLARIIHLVKISR